MYLVAYTEYHKEYLSMWLVVMNMMRASVDATPSSALRRPLYVRDPMPS